MSCVIDASVAVKWFVKEHYGASAMRLLYAQRTMLAPDLILAEVGNAMWRKWRMGFVSEAQVGRVHRTMSFLFAELTPLQQLSEEASRLSLYLDHPIYDCIYVALARRQRLPMVSFDDRLRKRLEKSETTIDCLNPDEYLAGRA